MHRIDGPGATADNKFTEGDPVGGVQATVVTDDFLNDVQEELMSVLTAAGVAPVKGTQDQVFKSLAKLLQSQKLTAFTTAGTATVLTLAPLPAIDALEANQRFRVKFNLTTGANPTLNVSGKGAKSLKQYDSSGAKVAAVVAAGQLSDIEYDGTDWVILEKKSSSTGVTAPQFDNSQNFATTAWVKGVGKQYSSIAVATTTYTATAANAGGLVLGNSSSLFNAVLPSAALLPPGATITFFCYGAGTMQVYVAGSDTINFPPSAVTSFPVVQGAAFTLTSNGINAWYAEGVLQSTESTLGVAKIATQSQANTGTDDATIVTPKKLAAYCILGFQVILGDTGCIKFPSFFAGLTFQWTKTPSLSTNTTYTWNFPLVFATKCAGVIGTQIGLSQGPTEVSVAPTQSSVGLAIGIQTAAVGPAFAFAWGW